MEPYPEEREAFRQLAYAATSWSDPWAALNTMGFTDDQIRESMKTLEAAAQNEVDALLTELQAKKEALTDAPAKALQNAEKRMALEAKKADEVKAAEEAQVDAMLKANKVG